jgi:protein transport protein HofC
VTTEFADKPPGDDASLMQETWRANDLRHGSAGEPRHAVHSGTESVGEAAQAAETSAGAGSDEPDSPGRRGGLRIHHLLVLVAAVAVVLWMVITLRFFLVALILLAFVAAVAAGFVWARLRTSQQDSLLAILAIAAERGMPLGPAVAAFADQYRGATRARAQRLAKRLNLGALLPQALLQTRKAVPRDATLMAWVGQATGMMARALRLAGSARSAQLSLWLAIASRLSYLLGVLLVMQILVTFIMYFIIPKFEAIFKDFGIGLPTVTIYAIEASHFLVKIAPATSIFLLVELACLLYIPFSFSGWMNYNVPIFDRLLSRRHTALILRALSLVVEGNVPISTGLSTLAAHYPTWWVRRKLARVERNVERGVDWIDALWRGGLIRSAEAEVLASAASVGNLPWAMRELADTTERRQSTRMRMAVETLFPLTVVLLGIVVSFLALAYFIPLVSLIARLSELP